MSKATTIISNLEEAIENVRDYIQFEERAIFEIMDFKGQSYIIEKINDDNTCQLIQDLKANYDFEKVFKLSNAKGIYFIPIDGKEGLLGYGNSWCDCVFFDENSFCFVEFKTDSTSEKKINENTFKGLSQLGNTINFFDEKLNYYFQDLKMEAYLCTPSFYKTVRESAMWEDIRVEFLEEYEIELFETNEKICL